MKKSLILFMLIIVTVSAVLIVSVSHRPDDVTNTTAAEGDILNTTKKSKNKNLGETETEAETETETVSKPESYTEEQLSKMIAFTFDDGPNAETTSRVLDAMEPYGYTATFFVVGRNIDENGSKVMQRAVEMGCEIGNHTQNHNLKFDSIDVSKRTDELELSNDKIEAAVGTRAFLMRPPGGICTNIRGNIKYPIILWSVDTNDWRKKKSAGDEKAVAEMAQYILDQVDGKPGSIVLMHDIYKFSAESVEKVMPMLHEKGYIVCSVSNLAKAYGTTLDGGKSYRTIEMNTQSDKT